MLLVRMHGRLRVYRGAWWPGCREPVQSGRQMVLDCVVVVVRLCWLRVVPQRQWKRWQGLVVVIGVSVVHMMVWCFPVRRVGWVACGAWGAGAWC